MSQTAANLPLNFVPPTPAGLQAINDHCKQIYPNQSNPLQVTALLKYWLGGPDPLDYISIYANNGLASENIPPHWHYISLGLSDLHGDGRVYEPRATGVDPLTKSGFGFELTFRLMRNANESKPPTWPAEMMQSLAKYVHSRCSAFQIGDHVSFHRPLDFRTESSRVRHMLIGADHQLSTLQTPFGCVDFLQIVGITARELEVAQKWNGSGVLNIMRRYSSLGGAWLITNLQRADDISNIDVSIQNEINDGFRKDGSNLSGVCGHCSWFAIESRAATQFEHELVRFRTLADHGPDPESDFTARKSDADTRTVLAGVHLLFDCETAGLLTIAVRGRILHGRHFTFDAKFATKKITLVSERVTGASVNEREPFVLQGVWLQVLVPDALAHRMLDTFDGMLPLAEDAVFARPKTFHWPCSNIAITIVP